MRINIFDYLLLPLFFFLLFFIVKKLRKKLASDNRKKIFTSFFLIHCAGSILHSLVIQYYYGAGDSLGYFDGGEFIKKAFIDSGFSINTFFVDGSYFQNLPNSGSLDPYTFATFGLPSTFFVTKCMAFCSIFSFSHYMINALFFGFLSFIGTWLIFYVFNDASKEKIESKLAKYLIYTPTIWFWGSGAGKDSLALGLLGILVYGLYDLFITKRKPFIKLALIILSSFFLFSLKAALLGITLASCAGYLFVNLTNKTKSFFVKILIVSLSIVGFVFLINSSLISIQESLDETAKFIESNIEVYSNGDEGQGGFEAYNFDVTPIGILKASPTAIFTSLYRPFIWETKKPIMLISAFESLLLLFGFLYVLIKGRFFGFFKVVFSSPPLIFCFVFSALMAMIVGFTTFNFGTAVRYRLPLLPFYVFLILYSNYLLSKKQEV